ncbi:hypothetical protein ACWDD9_03855 [Kitasatospora sp. NPDC001119]|uniref:hypothetical protein n=1 Tax=Kitasatospora TaxID=2063 RepID=UPI0015F342F4|nr:hypothetical protein [Kitasatospora xanthocidica]
MSRLRRFVRKTALMSVAGVALLALAYSAASDVGTPAGAVTVSMQRGVVSDLDVGWS